MHEKFIQMQERKTSEVKFHHDIAPGLRYLAIDQTLWSEAPIYIAVRKVTEVSANQPEYIDRHVHSVDSLYLFIGDNKDLTGLNGIVRINDEEQVINSPMTVFIPSGKPHSYKLTGGSGIYISVLLDGDYNRQTLHGRDKEGFDAQP